MKASYRLTLHTPCPTPQPSLWTPSHSWVRQYMQMMRVHWGYQDDVAVRGTDNVLHTANRSQLNQHQSLIAPITQDDYGLQVGSGVGAESPQDYKIGTRIDHGVGGGQLQYGLCAVAVVVIDADDQYVDVTRTFTNGSGGVVTVREVSLVAFNTPDYFLLIRDVLDAPSNVPHAGIITLTYRLQVTN